MSDLKGFFEKHRQRLDGKEHVLVAHDRPTKPCNVENDGQHKWRKVTYGSYCRSCGVQAYLVNWERRTGIRGT